MEKTSRKVVYTGKSSGEVMTYAEQNGFNLGRGTLTPEQLVTPSSTANFKAPRPTVKNPAGSDPKVTHELPVGREEALPRMRLPGSTTRTTRIRRLSGGNSGGAESGPKMPPTPNTHALSKRGAIPLFIEPGFGGPQKPHSVVGTDGLTDAQRWGIEGGKTGGRGRPKQP